MKGSTESQNQISRLPHKQTKQKKTKPNKQTKQKTHQHLLGTVKFIVFFILSALLTQSVSQLIFTKCLSLLHLNQYKNCTCFMRPMCASDS